MLQATMNEGRRARLTFLRRTLRGGAAVLAACGSVLLGASTLMAGDEPQQAGAVSALLPRGVAERPAGPKDLGLRDPLFWNDLVKTLEAGRLRITLEDKSVLNIGARSSMRIVQHDLKTQQSRLELEYGRVRAVVVKRLAPGGSFELTTRNAALGVVGTHFYVRGDEKETTVICLEDQVRVRNRDPNVHGEELLSAGELTTVVGSRPPTPKRSATPQEIRQAMEETMPARLARFEPFQSPAGSQPRVVLTGPNLERFPELRSEDVPIEIEPGPCATSGYVSARLKLKLDLKPGPYEFTFNTPDGPTMAAFLVQPPASALPAVGRMVHAPQVPAGALHRAVVVDEAAKPLAGARVRVRQDGKDNVLTTDASGVFEPETSKPGTAELFLEGTDRQSRMEIVKASEFHAGASQFALAGDALNLPGVFSGARVGDRALALATTQLKKGESFSTVMLPLDQEDGPSEITLVDAAGKEHRQSVFIYRILGGRIDDPNLISGQTTQGEFVVCFGNALPSGQQLKALITAKGFIRFLGEGAQGQAVRKTITVAGQGTARIPFQVQATKGAGPGVPFFINLSVSD